MKWFKKDKCCKELKERLWKLENPPKYEEGVIYKLDEDKYRAKRKWHEDHTFPAVMQPWSEEMSNQRYLCFSVELKEDVVLYWKYRFIDCRGNILFSSSLHALKACPEEKTFTINLDK